MKRLLPCLVMMITAGCASGPGQPAGPPAIKVGNYTAETGPTPVGVIPMATLHDAQRNKDVGFSVDYPTRGGPFPVIVFSHAYGLSNRDYEPLIAYWTSNGYVCIRVAHADAGLLRQRMQEMMPEPPRGGMQQRRRGAREMPPQQAPQTQAAARPNPMEEFWEKQTPAQWGERAADIRFVLDSLNQIEQQFPELQGKMDHAKIGVAGHSYGALTALLAAGLRTFGNPPLQGADRRIKAVIALSPPAVAENHGITPQSFADVHVPVLFMTTGDDQSAFENSPAGDKYSVQIAGGGPMTFTGMTGFRGGFERERPVMTSTSTYDRQQPQGAVVMPGRRSFEVIEITTLAFWDAYLNNGASAHDLLQPEKYSASFSGATLVAK